MHYQTEVDDTTTHTNVTQSQYLKNFDFNINGYLHEQTWANLISKNSINQWNSLYGNVLFAKKRRI